MTTLKIVTWNVLLDDYINKDWYTHVREQELLEPGARHGLIVDVIAGLNADVIGLQEADAELAMWLNSTGMWQEVFWTKKAGAKKLDGCILLVRHGLEITHKSAYHYGDGSGHLMQRMVVADIEIFNTHIKWGDPVREPQVGVLQTAQLIAQIGTASPAVLLADGNYRPGELPHDMILGAGFTNVHGNEPTALVDGIWAALDLAAVRGLTATPLELLTPSNIPRRDMPSDHVPVTITVELP